MRAVLLAALFRGRSGPGRRSDRVRHRERHAHAVALLGERGLLTSDSTRIDGLVTARMSRPAGSASFPTRTRQRRSDARRPDRAKRPLRLPLTIALAALLIGLAFVRPATGPPRPARRAGREPLARPVLALVAESPCSSARSRLRRDPPAYLVSMGIDAEAVALSPFGPSQSGRFYGVNNLLETMLLVPSLAGAALLGRAGSRLPCSRS